jgi:hypothetical protein
MAQNQSGSGQPPPEDINDERRADNDSRRRRPVEPEQRTAAPVPPPLTARQKWNQAQPTKTILFWACLASVVLTIVVGFTWGGWVRASTAEKMANTAAKTAIIQRLAPICVAQFNQDPERVQKLQVLKDTGNYERTQYVTDQLWATMPGDEKPSDGVAKACANLLTEMSQ